jgi:hypothetical protein
MNTDQAYHPSVPRKGRREREGGREGGREEGELVNSNPMTFVPNYLSLSPSDNKLSLSPPPACFPPSFPPSLPTRRIPQVMRDLCPVPMVRHLPRPDGHTGGLLAGTHGGGDELGREERERGREG